MNVPSLDPDEQLIRKIETSSLFKTYRKAFFDATGLGVKLLGAGGATNPCGGGEHENPFCQLLNNRSDQGCTQCAVENRCLAEEATEKVRTTDCFAGMKETAVPVRVGGKTFAHLKTGQVFTKKPTKAGFEQLSKVLAADGLGRAELARLRKAYFATPIVPVERYRGVVTLLAAFALQLAALVNRIALEQEENEPSAVTMAREYIEAHLSEKLTLDHVAAHVNVSPFYFCKLFKQATGMTFTAYVNRSRVELAKRRLLRPDARVTEVAYDVGYQSLSQFNRSFLKYAGESPTRYRERMKKQEELAAA